MADPEGKQWWSSAKRTTSWCLFIAASCAFALYLFCVGSPDLFDELWTLYDRSLRGSMFSGFLSVAGFLLALHTFIVVKMKEEVYENDAYIEKLHNEYSKSAAFSRYAPLGNLSGLLFSSILWSVLAALGQLTIGLIESVYPFCALLTTVFTAIFVFIVALYYVRTNIHEWLDLMAENEHILYSKRMRERDNPKRN
ncbi:MAG: hypothetical protein NTW86_08040 [Candidatus Sumerlaeota bacterium]|nr:hypothetical protein [Candidatus Sumerlaeota bacterium]